LQKYKKWKSYSNNNKYGFDSLCQILSASLVNNKAYNNALLETSLKLILCAKVLIKEELNAHFFADNVTYLSQVASKLGHASA